MQPEHAAGRHLEAAGVEDLAADVGVQTQQGQACRVAQDATNRLGRLPAGQAEAELLVLVRGGDVLMGVRLDTDRDPDHDRCHDTESLGGAGHPLDLLEGVDHDAGDPVTKCRLDLGDALVVAVYTDPPAGQAGGRIGVHGNNKSVAEIEAALRHGVARIVVDSFEEIERVAGAAKRLGVMAPVMVRVTVGVEAHTHEYIATAHEDQKFGFSLAGGQAAEAVRRILGHPASLSLLGLHSHIGSQIFDTSGFEVAARRVLGLHLEVAREHDIQLPELDLGGGFGIAYTTQHDPMSARDLAIGMAQIVARVCGAEGVPVPKISVEPGRAIAGPSTFTLYEVGTVKEVLLDGDASRTYVAVDGGMSDNIRPALYDADYSCTIASRASQAPATLARVVGKHCESGDILVKDEFLPSDIRAGDLLAVPVTGAYCRSLSSQYNHTPRPPVVAVARGAARQDVL